MDHEQLSEALKDYHWMVNEIARQRKLLEDAGTRLVAQGGIESAMPKAKGDPSDPISMEVVRRDKKHAWIAKLERKVSFIQDRMHVIESHREKLVLECLLDGMSMTAIGKHTGLSRRHIHNIRESIIDQMLACRISHFSHFTHKMTNEKTLV